MHDADVAAPFKSPRLLAEHVAWSQDGLLTSSQARASGMTKDAIYRLVRTGAWARPLPRVLRVGPPREWPQMVHAACLWAGRGAAASHRAAAALYELEGVVPGTVEVTCPSRRRPPADWLLVHESSEPFRIRNVRGIPVTTVERTLIDLSSVLSLERLERALEDALRRRLTSIPTLMLALPATGGRRAARSLRDLLRARSTERSPTDSQLELRVLHALDHAGFPGPVTQYPVSGPGGFRARLDFAYPDALVAVEADSYRWHSGRRAFVRDRERLSRLAALGWRVVHVTSDDLTERRDGWLESLRGLIGQQRLGPRA